MCPDLCQYCFGFLDVNVPSSAVSPRYAVQRGTGEGPEGGAEGDGPLHPAGVRQWEPRPGQHAHTQDGGAVLQRLGGRLLQLLGN